MSISIKTEISVKEEPLFCFESCGNGNPLLEETPLEESQPYTDPLESVLIPEDIKVKMEELDSQENFVVIKEEMLEEEKELVSEGKFLFKLKDSKYPLVSTTNLSNNIFNSFRNDNTSEITLSASHESKVLKNEGQKLIELNERGVNERVKCLGNYECNHCGKTYKRNSELKKHIIIHTNDKLFECSECNFKCNRKVNLKRHELTHSKIKLFSCCKCDFKCNRRDDLKRHTETHSDVRSFACPECTYKSTRKEHVLRHLATHGSVKPFSCSECNFECSRKDYLKRHMAIHRTSLGELSQEKESSDTHISFLS